MGVVRMDKRTEREVYDLADDALAHLHQLKRTCELDNEADNGRRGLPTQSAASQAPDSRRTIERNLELIRRRTDPAQYDTPRDRDRD